MATSKKTAAGKKAASAKAAKATPKAKSAAKKSGRRSGPGGHVFQIDDGWFYMYQNNLEVGQVVVVGSVPNSTEYFFLYQSGYGTGQGAYTWPSANNTPVITKYSYAAPLPPNWTTPSKYQSKLYPIINQLITSVCTSTAMKKSKAR